MVVRWYLGDGSKQREAQPSADPGDSRGRPRLGRMTDGQPIVDVSGALWSESRTTGAQNSSTKPTVSLPF